MHSMLVVLMVLWLLGNALLQQQQQFAALAMAMAAGPTGPSKA